MSRRFYGLVGAHLSHSMSPAIHERLGLSGYRLYEVAPGDLKRFLSSPNMGGVNVTIPYKVEAMGLCDVVDSSARAIGAVNTIVRRGKKLYGYNTDKYGFRCAARRAGIRFYGKKVLVLGSGGGSRAVVAAAKTMGARDVVVISRSGPNNYGNLNRHFDAGIIVNATPVGMYPDCPASPLSLAGFRNLSGVMDLIYNPLRTGLLMEAERRGIPCAGGLYMLVAQAKAAEEIFFSCTIPDSIVEGIVTSMTKSASNIVLVGMPGCGKTTIGKFLARLTRRELVDMDRYFAASVGCNPAEVLESSGEAKFRELETECLREVTKVGGRIITTGGGVVTRPENYPLLHQTGRIYLIERELKELTTRGRPLSAGGIETLEAMYSARAPLYRSFADVTIKNEGALNDIAETIWRDFCENTRY